MSEKTETKITFVLREQIEIADLKLGVEIEQMPK